MENLRGSISAQMYSYITNEEANRKCFDCNAFHPDWCSLSFGILICLSCSGQHRGLGVHVTLVKSITLDRWEDRQLRFIKYGGNAKLKAYFEDSNEELSASIDEKYKTRNILYYRELLEAKVDEREARPNDEDFNRAIDDIVHSKKEPISNSQKLTSTSPQEWILDSEQSNCSICKSNFNLFRRRHHCRRCGGLVCNKCAPAENSRPILEWGMKDPVRHCKNCYKSPIIDWTS